MRAIPLGLAGNAVGAGQVRLFLEHLPDILAIGQRLSDAEASVS
jgi:hypothetical protein